LLCCNARWNGVTRAGKIRRYISGRNTPASSPGRAPAFCDRDAVTVRHLAGWGRAGPARADRATCPLTRQHGTCGPVCLLTPTRAPSRPSCLSLQRLFSKGVGACSSVGRPAAQRRACRSAAARAGRPAASARYTAAAGPRNEYCRGGVKNTECGGSYRLRASGRCPCLPLRWKFFCGC
jgi:hypothetical protein